MNLTGQGVYQKGQKKKKRSRPPNALEIEYRESVRAIGCIVKGPHKGRTTTHHCGTGGGGRKDHMELLPLCEHHHTGVEGINGHKISRREWEEKYGTEEELRKILDGKMKQIYGENYAVRYHIGD